MKNLFRTLLLALLAVTSVEAANVTFADYAASTSPVGTDYLVGYRPPMGAGAEKRFTLATLATYFQTGLQPVNADLTALAALTGTNTLYYRSAANTWTPVTIGSNLTFSGGTLSATGGSATWGGISGTISAQTDLVAALAAKATKAQTLKVAGVGVDGGGAAIPTATSTDTRIEQAATLTSLTLYLPYGVTGSVTVSIQKNGTTISGSTPVVLSSANYVTVTNFSGFTTTSFAAGDIFGATTTGTPTATHFQLTAAGTVTLN